MWPLTQIGLFIAPVRSSDTQINSNHRPTFPITLDYIIVARIRERHKLS
jgi:hypothetical protein